MDRTKLRRAKWWLTGFFLLLGVATLAAYMQIGYEHRDAVGERYHANLPGVVLDRGASPP
jgi:fumarate reductase subunit C